MPLYDNKKVPIFSGINDTPIAPTASSGGNISHFYNLYNGFFEDVKGTVDALWADIGTLFEAVYDTNGNSRIDSLSTQLATLSSNANSAIEQLDITVTDITQQLAGISQQINGLNTAISELQVSDYSVEINNLSVLVGDLSNTVDTLVNRIEALEGSGTPQYPSVPANWILEGLTVTGNSEDNTYLFDESTTLHLLTKIIAIGASNIYDIFPAINGSGLSLNGWNALAEGHEITFDNVPFKAGDTFSVTTGGSSQSGIQITLVAEPLIDSGYLLMPSNWYLENQTISDQPLTYQIWENDVLDYIIFSGNLTLADVNTLVVTIDNQIVPVVSVTQDGSEFTVDYSDASYSVNSLISFSTNGNTLIDVTIDIYSL